MLMEHLLYAHCFSSEYTGDRMIFVKGKQNDLLYCKEISRDLIGQCAGNIYHVPWQNPRKSSFPIGGPRKHFFRFSSRSKIASFDTSRQPGYLVNNFLH